jgi:transposase
LRATQLALKSLAVRYEQLTAEIEALGAQLDQLVAEAAPDLVAVKGIGTDIATTLLTTAGNNPDRLRSEGTFARLCGVAPIPASSGKTNRHRLNRGGDRDANRALAPARRRADGLGPGDTSLRQAAHYRRTVEDRDPPLSETYIARELSPLYVHNPALLTLRRNSSATPVATG